MWSKISARFEDNSMIVVNTKTTMRTSHRHWIEIAKPKTATMPHLFVSILDTIVGSFLNVCIVRIPKSESVISPPSHCPTCNTSVAFDDNIPLISYLFSAALSFLRRGDFAAIFFGRAVDGTIHETLDRKEIAAH